MTDTIELEILMKRKGISKKALAEKLGLSVQGLHKKMNNESEFKASEIFIIAKLLDIQTDSKIFFYQS